MSSSRIIAIVSIAAASVALVPSFSRGQDTPAEDVANSNFRAIGKVNANAVYVRSGPSDNDYPVCKLDKDAEITAVGEKFGWLKIVPPPGSFCYVAKAYVEKRGDGKVGRVTNTLNVRVGSSLIAMKTRVATKLDPGVDVQILDEQDEYFKIAPPEGVFLYVNKQFVDPVKALAQEPAKTPEKPVVDSGNAVPPIETLPPAPTKPPETVVLGDPLHSKDASAVIDPNALGGVPATQPDVATTPPTTQPIVATSDIESQFDKAEMAYEAAGRQAPDKQPLAELVASYSKLAASTELPESLRRIADERLLNLKDRAEVQSQYAAVKARQDDMASRQVALQAERQEIEAKIKASGVTFYTAVGMVRPSSLQQGKETLYRLTDPKSGRTMLYIRSNDPAYAAMAGQFVGLRGDVADDSLLGGKVITPTAVEVVDAAQVNQRVAAQIIPASLAPAAQ